MHSPVLPRLWLSEQAARTIKAAAISAHPNETGGVLIGVFTTGGRPWIAQAVVVPSAAATGTYYELPAHARPQAVEAAREMDPRLGYLGDWHSHPADIGPSSVDSASMGLRHHAR